MIKIKVLNSLIEGKGVIATRQIKKGERIFVIKGKLKKFLVHNKEDSQVGPNWIGIDKNLWLSVDKPYVYLNHSCDPNAGIKGRVLMYALRDIKEGEEVTFDYSTTEEDILWDMECYCGSNKCRKKIRSIQFLPKAQFNKYLPYIPTYFRNVYLKHYVK